MSLSYGTDGIKQKDYRVFVALLTTGVSGYRGYYLCASSILLVLVSLTCRTGECRADSLTWVLLMVTALKVMFLEKLFLTRPELPTPNLSMLPHKHRCP